jgi:hypothetical protein
MNNLLNWVNTWKPAIVTIVKSAHFLAANTMKRMDGLFGYLTPSTKRLARSRVQPGFHTPMMVNAAATDAYGKALTSVRPLSAYFAQIPTTSFRIVHPNPHE